MLVQHPHSPPYGMNSSRKVPPDFSRETPLHPDRTDRIDRIDRIDRTDRTDRPEKPCPCPVWQTNQITGVCPRSIDKGS